MTFMKWLGVGLAAATLSVAVWAQQSPAPIALNVVVTAKKGGAPVAGLTAHDFTVQDNGKPQKITSFSALGGSKAPLEVILVIDTVDSYYTAVAYERTKIDQFLRANGGRLEYPMQMAFFSDTGTQIQNGFTKDGNAESKVLDSYTVGLRQITRASGIYGAGERLNLAMKTMQLLCTYGARLPGRKLLIWMSPGWPMLTGPGIEISSKQQQGIFRDVVALSTGLRAAQMTVYSIDPGGTEDASSIRNFYWQNFVKGVKKPTNAQMGNLALQVLAAQTGGQVLNASNDLTAQINKAMTDTDAYYHLTFDPVPGEPDEYHKLEVKVAKPGLVARTRTGYYNE